MKRWPTGFAYWMQAIVYSEFYLGRTHPRKDRVKLRALKRAWRGEMRSAMRDYKRELGDSQRWSREAQRRELEFPF